VGYLSPLPVPLFVALGVALFLTPACRRLALRFGVVDRPGGKKIHGQTTPLLGGVAIALALAAGMAASGTADQASLRILVASGFILLLGIWDDLDPHAEALRWWLRLLYEGCLAGIVVAGGVRIHFLGTPWLDVPVTPQRGQIFVTEPLPPLMTIACLYGKSPNPYIYWRQTRHGSLTIGGCRTVDTHGDWLLGGPGPASSLDIQKMILETIVKVHPGIADVSLIRWWAGVMGFTPDRLPILGRSQRYANLVSAYGFCPNGILCAPLTGRVIADVVTGAEPEVTLEPYRLERFATTGQQ